MRQKRWFQIFLLIVLCTLGLAGCQTITNVPSSSIQVEESSMDIVDNISGEMEQTGGLLKIHVINVGQGDSILIQSEDKNLLIDAGENNMGVNVVTYIKSQGITKLDYVIGTHPHSDHIGGLDTVINEMEIGTVILPAVEHSTKTFEDVLLAIKSKGLKITKPVVGNEYKLGAGSFQIIAPNSAEYEDLNDYSVGIRLVYGDTSYVFAGDADTISEQEMCNNGLNLKSDVLKLNHHGSAYSNQKEFIDAISPTYAIISVGEGNSYGHPHKEVLEDMKKRGIEVFRTDYFGTIVIRSDGKKISFNELLDTESSDESSNIVEEIMEDETAKEEVVEENDTLEEWVYITTTGRKYHKEECSYLGDSATKITMDEAMEKEYAPCSRCY